MLWICLTAWAGLFIWYFRMRKKAEDHKLVRRIFCLAATGFIAGTALCLPIGVRKVSGDEKAELQLERGALGSQPTEEKLEVSVGNQKPERITLSVPARAYSAEEIEEAFSAAIEALDEIILGENLSFHTVNRNMDLVTEIPGSPVALSWETDRPLLIDSRGLLSDEIPEEGVEVTLKAELELQGETTEYIRKVQVYPPEIKGRDAVLRALKRAEEDLGIFEPFKNQLFKVQEGFKKAVEKENEAHPEETAYYLPETLNGETVTWSKVPDLTGLELMALAAAAGAVCWAAKGREQEKERQKREEQMLRDYPEIVSKMVLLLGAGLGMRKVLERIAVDYRKNLALGGQKRFAYEEIVFTCQEMENGVSEQEAYQRMGMRMGTGAYRSLAVLLTQNLKKGSKGLLELLKQESQEAFEERRRQAKTTGEKASTKLLLPMGMMLAVVLVILTVPAFLSFCA